MDIRKANLFVTGGAGTLGRAIARRRQKEGWTGRFTVYSRSEHHHAPMRRLYPDIQYVQGDIRNLETLKLAMVGHDVCLHLGAAKVIPVAEYYPMDTLDNNVYGSMNVCMAARETGVEHVLGISTDKACHACNLYGSTKYVMEKIFQEYARAEPACAGRDGKTQFHLVRYGNVIESNGSVVQAWKSAVDNGQPVKITFPEMTRFWLSPSQAVDYVIASLESESGHIYIPRTPALSIGKLLDYTVGRYVDCEYIPLRPGEKLHETLLTYEEGWYAGEGDDFYDLWPTTTERNIAPKPPYTSDTARELTEDELKELLADV